MAGTGIRPVLILMTGAGEYQVQVTSGIARTLRVQGIPVLAVSVAAFASESSSAVVLDLIRRRRTQGVIALADASGFEKPDLLDALLETGTPTVTLGVKRGRFPRVRGDNVSGMRAIMRHLLDDRSIRRLALVRGTPDHIDSQTREQVFREECGARGIVVDEGLVVDGHFQPKPAYNAFRELLGRRRDFDAVVALNDPSAHGVIYAITDHGLRVPEDILVTGFDNVQLSDESWPPLTTVDQHLEEQGTHAAELLLRLIAGEPCDDDRQVTSEIVVRTSTTPGDVDHAQVMTVLRSQQARLTQQMNGMLFSGDMANCRSVDDVIATLDPCLTQMGIRRCFIGLDHLPAGADDDGTDTGTDTGADTGPDTGPGTGPDAADDRSARPTALAFSYRNGTADRLTGEVFGRHQLLPPSLRSELAEGVMLLQPLSIGGRERGYLLHDLNVDHPWLTYMLHIELPRTIDTVFSSKELRNHASTLERLVTQRTLELEETNSALQLANVALQHSAACDGLTGIANRKAFQEFLEGSFLPDGTETGAVALLMIDVDAFKAFNDRYGHLAGDEALKTVASCLDRSVGAEHGLACRYGGEEFAVILRDADTASALDVARRFRELLAGAAIAHEASGVAPVLTASVGVAGAVAPGSGPTALIDAADQALYRAKVEGRHRVVASEPAPGIPGQRTAGDAGPAGTGPCGPAVRRAAPR